MTIFILVCVVAVRVDDHNLLRFPSNLRLSSFFTDLLCWGWFLFFWWLFCSFSRFCLFLWWLALLLWFLWILGVLLYFFLLLYLGLLHPLFIAQVLAPVSETLVNINGLIKELFIEGHTPVPDFIVIDHRFVFFKGGWGFPGGLILPTSDPLYFVIGFPSHELFPQNFLCPHIN